MGQIVNEGAPALIEYGVDGDDRLVSVGGDWVRFAQENGAPDLLPAAVVGRSLWDFVWGREVVSVFRMLMHEVRARRIPVRVPFSCDAPAVRREMQLELRSSAGGGIAFRSHPHAARPRDPVRLLSEAVRRSAEIIEICSFCRQVRLSGVWRDISDASSEGLLAIEPLPSLAESVCGSCLARVHTGGAPA